MLRWYCAHTLPRAEGKAITALRRHKIDTVFPRQLDLTVRSPRTLPLFPNYIFIHLDVDQPDWPDIYVIAPIRRLLCATGFDPYNPTPVPDLFIRDLLQVCSENQIAVRRPPETGSYLGKKIRIRDGPYMNVMGIVTKVSKKRLGIEAIFKYHQSTLDIPIDAVELL